MIFKSATIRNLRPLEHAELPFDPRITLIVGVNGQGKSTILDALRIVASRILPPITKSRAKAMSFSTDDIKNGLPFLDVEVTLELNNSLFRYTRRQWREKFAIDDTKNLEKLKREILNAVRLRERARNLLRELNESLAVGDTDNFFPSEAELVKAASASPLAPNCIFFGTTRSYPSDASATKSKAAGAEAAAYAEALSPRPLYLAQFSEWMRVQEELSAERPIAARHLDVLRSAVRLFLPDCDALRADTNGTPRLLINKNGTTLDVRQLSDGERGVLALVLDLARRLSQANPILSDPLREGSAIVLIDELDLHLHPKWQRTIVQQLAKAFPRCQFIATTHSPQIVAAVEPEQVLLLLTKKGVVDVVQPDRTLGMDSNWILRHLMETDERPADTARAIETVEALVSKGAYAKARKMIALHRKKWPDIPDWAVLEARMARMEVLAK
jgi:predicted ATP-binding protein involved in virulence